MGQSKSVSLCHSTSTNNRGSGTCINQRLLRENRNTNLDDAQPGEHLDSSPPSLVASFQFNKVAHYTGKIKRKSKVEHTLDRRNT